jgi:Pyruvate phosphate dikinase, AMP/ATP-binding domain/PEP-utilising enzyme, mobile domain
MTGRSGDFHRLLPLAAERLAAEARARNGGAMTAGAKAARLSAAARAGLPVLPGWVVPCAEAHPALSAAATAVSRGDPAAARRAALSCPLDPALGTELTAAVAELGGQAIVRSSSPLERDPRWSGAFSSIAEVGADDATTAVRSCWAAAFAADPLARLRACGLSPEAMQLGIVIQPELRPDAGGTARVTTRARSGDQAWRDGDLEVEAEGVAGHPGPLLAGWAEGVSGPGLANLIGVRLAGQVARLAARVFRLLGDDTIEWAVQDGTVWLLQSGMSGGRSGASADGPPAPPTPTAPDERWSAREWMPLLAADVRARGQLLRARPAAPGVAAGRLVPCRPHERPAASCLDAILLVDRPVPALAPLLFGARGLIARAGAASSHLAEVARSLAVPMVTGCQLPAEPAADLPGFSWLAAIDGTVGEVALLPG